jgi:hypothetical protein
MIEVSVTLISARDGSKTELARMHICNDETGTLSLRNYISRVLRGRSTKQLDADHVHKTGTVKNWPAESRHVWHLVAVALGKMGYGSSGAH